MKGSFSKLAGCMEVKLARRIFYLTSPAFQLHSIIKNEFKTAIYNSHKNHSFYLYLCCMILITQINLKKKVLFTVLQHRTHSLIRLLPDVKQSEN